jgi:hypothetical protein
MYSAWAPFGFLAGLFLGLLCLQIRHAAFGRCAVCELERAPKCKSRDPKDYL